MKGRHDKDETKIPNPGSDEAVLDGCSCPILDNARGQGARTLDKDWDTGGQFWIRDGCPLHTSTQSDLARDSEERRNEIQSLTKTA